MITEPTSSVLILCHERERGWVTALVWHPRLECWLPAGGHVEADETAAQCGIRESLEETGLEVTLVPGPAVPVPAGFPHRLVPAPWLVAEVRAAPDRHTSEPHVHEDHVYVATTASPRPVREPEHQVRWFTPDDIAAAPGISEDSRILAAALLTLAAPQPGPQFRWPQQGHATAAGHQADATASEGTRRASQDSGYSPRLIVIRGNSASGKSAAAAAIRDKYGRGLAIVGQDNLRRVVLREHDVAGGANIGLIDQTARFALSRGYHTIVEGIFSTDHYAEMLTALINDHSGRAFAYFLDVPFDETLRRHATKTGTLGYGEAEMRRWYRGLDLLPGGIEQVIPVESSLEDTASRVMADAGLKLTCPLGRMRPQLRSPVPAGRCYGTRRTTLVVRESLSPDSLNSAPSARMPVVWLQVPARPGQRRSVRSSTGSRYVLYTLVAMQRLGTAGHYSSHGEHVTWQEASTLFTRRRGG